MLFKCKTCGKVCRVNKDLITDYGSKIKELEDSMVICPCCHKITEYKIMNSEDWIENLVFRVKGN